jgi:hypothetical protein
MGRTPLVIGAGVYVVAKEVEVLLRRLERSEMRLFLSCVIPVLNNP